MKHFIKNLPKAELHVHIEGTFEAKLIFELAERNGVALSDTLRHGLCSPFVDLQSFLNVYFEALTVLRLEQDFYDLAWAYLLRAREDAVYHVEMFFNPQAHTERGIAFATVVNGLTRALEEAHKSFGMTSALIMDFTRTYSVEKAMETLEQSLSFKDKIIAVGLDSAELPYPPQSFETVFKRARDEGFKTVAHAGEEGPPEYIWQALHSLGVERIDHGVRSIEDEKLIQYLVKEQIPLTICPLSNIKLNIYPQMSQHPIMDLDKRGVLVTINSDDPSYFGGYIADNYLAVQKTFNLNEEQLIHLAINSFKASFIAEDLKEKYTNQVIEYAKQYKTLRVLESIKGVSNSLPCDLPDGFSVYFPAEDSDEPRIFSIHRDRQSLDNIRECRKAILATMGYSANAPVIQIIGDSATFGAETDLGHKDPFNRMKFARRIIESTLNKYSDHVVLYGLTGRRGDVNMLVNDWIKKDPIRKSRVIGNAVSEDTPIAIKEWNCEAGDVKNILLVYPHAKFGEDVRLSDWFVPQYKNEAGCSSALCLEGGAQSFLQVVNMLGLGIHVTVVEKLRGPINAACKVGNEYRSFFSAAGFLSLVKKNTEKAKKENLDVTEEEIRQLKINYLYDAGIHGPYDPSKHVHLHMCPETKKVLLEKAFVLFFQQKTWEKLERLTVIDCEAELSVALASVAGKFGGLFHTITEPKNPNYAVDSLQKTPQIFKQ